MTRGPALRPTPTTRRRRPTVLALVLLVALAALVGATCADQGASTSASGAAGPGGTDGVAPAGADATRTVEHALGTTDVPVHPERVVSASVTMTGPLLGLGAPVVASMATRPSDLADEHGFFLQWAAVAVDAGVEPIAGPEVSIEAIAAARPDVIVGSLTGGDAVDEAVYDELSQIAPTIVLDASGGSWQELSGTVADALGYEEEAEAVVAGFDALVDEVSAEIATDHQVDALVVSPEGINVFTPESPHGQLLEQLGLTVHRVEGSAAAAEGGAAGRADIVSLSPEAIGAELGDSTLLFVYADEARVAEIGADPLWAAQPAFAEGRAVALGFSSFRLDQYSATAVVELLRRDLAA